MREVEKYGIFQQSLECGGEKAYIEDCVSFTCGEREYRTGVFKKGDKYTVRFSPDREGVWEYRVTDPGMSAGEADLAGSFLCVAGKENCHGKVTVKSDGFSYEDGTVYYPFGTTCYAWVNQTAELQRQTLDSLRESPFNKIRMCIFPKSMPYNNNEPDCFPFEKDEEGWDTGRPVEAFWENLDLRLSQLLELGIEADLILFHPYDRWGFASLTQEASVEYLNYCILRLAPYRNVWWSLANEYDVVYSKSVADFDEYGELLLKKDIYRHLCSVHNMIPVYPDRQWITHCSIQSGDLDLILRWKSEHSGKPVIVDEFGYEGDIEYGWGNLSGFEEVHRFWKAVMRGGFATHGETFHRKDEVLWWAKGGRLYGESPKRIAFFKELLYGLPEGWHAVTAGGVNPNLDQMDEETGKQAEAFQELLARCTEEERYRFQMAVSPMEIAGEGFRLQYFGRSCPCRAAYELQGHYSVEVIDVWEMTRETAANVSGHAVISLPGKEGIAVLLTELR